MKIVEGDLTSALGIFEQADRVGTQFADIDVTSLARHAQARVLLRMNRRAEGFALLDEVMLAVTGGEVVPMIAGVIYCSMISACYDVFDVDRAQEWTNALSGWCAAHPDIAPFRGQCLVRRSELMQLHGEWDDAVAEAQRATTLLARAAVETEVGAAHYQEGELYRLRGDLARAEESYRRASQAGRKPYPGLALLRLAQGNVEAAGAAARRMLEETRDARIRARLLGAAVEIMLARHDIASARAAADELSQIARDVRITCPARDSGASVWWVSLAAGESGAALELLRSALTAWQELHAPHEVGRIRELIGRAYRLLGDEEGAQMEFDAAQDTFDRLGAAPDAARVSSLVAHPAAPVSGALTGREVEVLRLVATGKTNRAIAARPLHQRKDRGSSPEQHLHQARPAIPLCRNGLRVRAQARLTPNSQLPNSQLPNRTGLGSWKLGSWGFDKSFRGLHRNTHADHPLRLGISADARPTAIVLPC